MATHRPTRRALLQRGALVAGGAWVAPQIITISSARAASGTFSLQLSFTASGVVEVAPTGSARCNPVGWNPAAPITLAAASLTVTAASAGIGAGTPTLSMTASGLCSFSAAVVEGFDETTSRPIPTCFTPSSFSATSLQFVQAAKYAFVTARIVVTCLS